MTNAMPTIIVPKGTPVSELAEGTLIKTTEAGAPVEFYLAKHDYESALNGDGRQLIVRKDCYDQRKWHTSNVNAWASCSLLSWLNGEYKALLDSKVQEMIGTTKYYYTPGEGSWSVTTRSDAIFLLSAYELGKSESWFNKEGTTLPNASNYQIAKLNGSTVVQWTRSPTTDDINYAIVLYTNGDVSSVSCIGTHGSRPAFTLPADALVDDDLNIIV